MSKFGKILNNSEKTSTHRAENIFPKYLLYNVHEIARKYPREKKRYSSFSNSVGKKIGPPHTHHPPLAIQYTIFWQLFLGHPLLATLPRPSSAGYPLLATLCCHPRLTTLHYGGHPLLTTLY
jgi:hypothetical protein